ncbi:hypothetical protein GCM10020358_18800 [Amorphoplanes nipponensis]|uniref:Uncharacterized protein n=1 Tax=Actinoplanes nipponensis TaxID=135950 RepID=A0A919JJH3_9ACTN|nr:hypothetical protein [Actinoplanes nipponensis]GIE50470.1 hypothetical protein Ani05nite_40040 [Actinoplanes nipponensis]
MRLPVVLAAVVLVVTFSAGAASASTGLGDGEVRLARTAQDYTYRTYQRHWSVVAVQPAAAADWDLTLRDNAGTTVATSLYGAGRTDFVAVDSNAGRRPLGAYTAAVTAYTPGLYWVQQHTGTDTITLPPVTHHGVTGAGDPDLAFAGLADHDVVSIVDIELSAGESFWATTTTAASSLFLLESDPSAPATFAQGRATAAARQHTQVLDGCTLYTAQVSGRHALVMIGDRSPETHDPTQGQGYALHRVDPSTPASCPQRNFPAPTP